jgi:hypothetical protein
MEAYINEAFAFHPDSKARSGIKVFWGAAVAHAKFKINGTILKWTPMLCSITAVFPKKTVCT